MSFPTTFVQRHLFDGICSMAFVQWHLSGKINQIKQCIIIYIRYYPCTNIDTILLQNCHFQLSCQHHYYITIIIITTILLIAIYIIIIYTVVSMIRTLMHSNNTACIWWKFHIIILQRVEITSLLMLNNICDLYKKSNIVPSLHTWSL